ncbi:hypothetical protein I6F26_31090 [Ensifer sp. IC3342]|nr:hypothetical protein [Ensifer sp. BRP08]MCA1450945.1 hypothetical protein [Ensifer sp. IC3342]
MGLASAAIGVLVSEASLYALMKLSKLFDAEFGGDEHAYRSNLFGLLSQSNLDREFLVLANTVLAPSDLLFTASDEGNWMRNLPADSRCSLTPLKEECRSFLSDIRRRQPSSFGTKICGPN